MRNKKTDGRGIGMKLNGIRLRDMCACCSDRFCCRAVFGDGFPAVRAD